MWPNTFKVLGHIQTLGSLVLVSQFHFCLVSSLNCDSLYISLAVADLTLWPPPKTHITRNPPICWHLSCDVSHVREPETRHSAQAGLLKAVRHSAGNTLLAVGRAEWGVSNPALERQQRCLPTNVCKYSPFAHQKKWRIDIYILDETFNLLQLDQPKAFQAVWYASASLHQGVSQAWFFSLIMTYVIKVYFNYFLLL